MLMTLLNVLALGTLLARSVTVLRGMTWATCHRYRIGTIGLSVFAFVLLVGIVACGWRVSAAGTGLLVSLALMIVFDRRKPRERDVEAGPEGRTPGRALHSSRRAFVRSAPRPRRSVCG